MHKPYSVVCEFSLCLSFLFILLPTVSPCLSNVHLCSCICIDCRTAADSSQFRDALMRPTSPEAAEVVEELCVASNVNRAEAVPFFDTDDKG